MKDEIRELMAVVFDCSLQDVTSHATYGSFELWDSLAHMRLIVALEETYEISLTDEEILEAISVDLIEDIVMRKRKV